MQVNYTMQKLDERLMRICSFRTALSNVKYLGTDSSIEEVEISIYTDMRNKNLPIRVETGGKILGKYPDLNSALLETTKNLGEFDKQRKGLLLEFKYALGRRTYIVGMVVDELVKNWHNISTHDKNQIHDDIKHAIEHSLAGDTCDVAEWTRLLRLNTN